MKTTTTRPFSTSSSCGTNLGDNLWCDEIVTMKITVTRNGQVMVEELACPTHAFAQAEAHMRLVGEFGPRKREYLVKMEWV